jgi:hypothetical protein
MVKAFHFGAVLAALLLLASPAYAYIDAGTGSMILQVLLGGLAGVAVAWRLFWHRIKDFFGGKKNE